MSYTPGPYTIVKANHKNGVERSQDYGIIDGHGHLVAEAFEIVGYTADREYMRLPAEANARLLAAAPRLAKALRELVSMARYVPYEVVFDRAINEADEALKEAGVWVPNVV